MIRKTLLCSVLALGLATASQAATRFEHRDRQASLGELAYRLHDASEDLARKARLAARFDRRGGANVSSLVRLERETDRFLRTVERAKAHDRRGLSRALERLCDVYETAEKRAVRVRSPRFRDDWRDVSVAMNRLAQRVEQITDHKPRDRDRGRNRHRGR